MPPTSRDKHCLTRTLVDLNLCVCVCVGGGVHVCMCIYVCVCVCVGVCVHSLAYTLVASLVVGCEGR